MGKRMQSNLRLAVVLGCFFLAAGTTVASELSSLREAARQAVTTNPDVLAAFSEFQAAEQQVRVARGGYLPRVDLEAAVGVERIDDPRFGTNDFSRNRISVQLSQMIFDGFATRSRVRAYGQESRMRYFEVLAASETIMAEVARAYFDVLRHRELVDLSKENYAAHRLILEQIERRARAGVSRRVDLEQSYGRLALSEANLLTDVTNLHDVSVRYQRLVGTPPAQALAEPEITPGLLPTSIEATLGIAYSQNPMINAAIAHAWSATDAANVVRGSMLPRFDVRLRQDFWDGGDEFSSQYDRGVAELVMTYNLYNGGADRAERRRLLHKADQAANLRNQVCRNIRQDVSIAFNEMRALEEQMVYLGRHMQAIGRAREAYRSQFGIGQRTLLDMLDTENEFYDARRAYVNAKRQYDVAYAQALAGVGALISALELGPDLAPMTLRDQGKAASPDIQAVCPAEPIFTPTIDKDAIFREALSQRSDLLRYRVPDDLVPDGDAPDSAAPTAAEQDAATVPPGW